MALCSGSPLGSPSSPTRPPIDYDPVGGRVGLLGDPKGSLNKEPWPAPSMRISHHKTSTTRRSDASV